MATALVVVVAATLKSPGGGRRWPRLVVAANATAAGSGEERASNDDNNNRPGTHTLLWLPQQDNSIVTGEVGRPPQPRQFLVPSYRVFRQVDRVWAAALVHYLIFSPSPLCAPPPSSVMRNDPRGKEKGVIRRPCGSACSLVMVCMHAGRHWR